MQYAVFLRDEYIRLSAFGRASSTYTFCIFYNQPRNIWTTFYILHFAGRINFLSCLYILHFAGQNIFSTYFTLYIFRHTPNSASTFCLRHYQFLPDYFTKYHRIRRNFWSDISKYHRLEGERPVKKELFPWFLEFCLLILHLLSFRKKYKIHVHRAFLGCEV